MFTDKNGHELKIGDYVLFENAYSEIENNIIGIFAGHTENRGRVDFPYKVTFPDFEGIAAQKEITFLTKEEVIVWKLEN